MRDYQEEAGFSNFSGTNNVFNQDIKNGNARGLYRAVDRSKRATIQISVENLSDTEQVYELFNANNSISFQPDNSLYAGRARGNGDIPEAYVPFDAVSAFNFGLGSAGSAPPYSVVGFTRKGDLLYYEARSLNATYTRTAYSEIMAGLIPVNQLGSAVLVSLKSTLTGNTYRRLVEKMKTSVLHVTDWKIQCSNEEQFQLSIAQKDFSITGASGDDEYQISSSVSSKDNNTKIVEIGDKMLLIDGDTRLSGIILPETKMVFTFDIDIINEVTKRVF